MLQRKLFNRAHDACAMRVVHIYELTVTLKWSALISLMANESDAQTNSVDCFANVLTLNSSST